jgi:hypothetical protein
MRKIRTAVLAAAAIAGLAGAAYAAETHVMKVALPDGSVAHVRYKGDVPPQIRVVPVRMVEPVRLVPVRVADPFLGPSPFAMMDRMMADMDRRVDAMMRQAAAMQARGPAPAAGVNLVSAGKLPAGTVSYRYVSINNGKTTCTQSVQVTSAGPNAQPKVVKASSGDCSAVNVNTNARPGTVSAPAKAKPPVADPKVRYEKTI